MTADEAARSDLFALLEPTLGRRAAMLLMNQIPPEGWPEFATRADLELLGTRLDGRIDALEERIAGSEQRVVAAFRGELLATTRHLAFSVIGAVLTTAGAVLGAVRLG